MNWTDGVIIFVFLLYLYEGYRRGFIEQCLELVGFVVTIFAAIWTYQPLANFLVTRVGLIQNAAEAAGFLLIWVAWQALYSLVLRLSYPAIPYKIRTSVSNRLAGIVPATLKATVIVAVLLTMTVIMSVPVQLKEEINSSAIGSKFVAQSSKVEAALSSIAGRDIKQSLTFLTVPAQTEEIVAPDERVDLKFSTTDVTVDTSSEQKMLNLVNSERAKAGLPALKWNQQLAEVGRNHAKDMLAKGYFAHENLDGLSPFDRMDRANFTYTAAGENIAYAANVDLAHGGLMRSPGHRANILSKDFGRVGIAVIDGGIYGKMFAQEFAD